MSKVKLVCYGLLGALLFSFAPLGAFALQDNFTQQILPLNCVFTIVNNGTRQIIYITPQACGVPVQSKPVVGNSKLSSSSHLSLIVSRPSHFVISPYEAVEGVTDYNSSPPHSSASNSAAQIPLATLPLLKFPLNLSPLANQNIVQSFNVTLQLEEIYTFPVISFVNNSSTQVTSFRSISVTSLNDNVANPTASIAVSTPSGSVLLSLHLGQTALLAVSNNNVPNIGITLNNLNSRLVSLTIWQLQPSNSLTTLGRNESQSNSTTLVIVISGLASVSLIWMIQKRIKFKTK